jgi:single-strand DNA-binding protein
MERVKVKERRGESLSPRSFHGKEHEMNNLNSVLLEGVLLGNPDCQPDEKGNPVCRLTLVSSRFFRTDGGTEKETCRIDVETTGKLALLCKKNGREGRGVRVVGRLKQERAEGKPAARVVIVAEHVEFRPDFTKNDTPLFSDGGSDDYVRDSID